MRVKFDIDPLPPSDFDTEFRKMLNAKYIIQATPLRVPTLAHDIHDPVKNRQFANYLKKQPSKVLLTSKRGKLHLFDTSLIFLTDDSEYPVSFFYMFKHVMFNHKPAVVEDMIECLTYVKDVRLDGLPISAYCIFKILLPQFKVVIGGNKHTASGERWSKRQIKEAIDLGFYVYIRNEHGILINADTYKVIQLADNYLWGLDKELHTKRFTVISVDPLI